MSFQFQVSGSGAKHGEQNAKYLKAQSAFEMFVSVATLLAFSVPIVLLALSSSGLRLEDLSLSHGKASVQQLVDNINEVYLEGNGSKRTMVLNLPFNCKNLTVSGNLVTIYLSTSMGMYEISEPVFANVGDFSVSRTGLVSVSAKMESGRVMLQ